MVELPKNTFMVNGKVADEMLYPGSQIPMSDAQGNRMLGIVKEVADDTVKMDFNHPLAGKDVRFDGSILTVRDATPEEIQPANGCGCGSCGDGQCGDGCDCGDGGCGCN